MINAEFISSLVKLVVVIFFKPFISDIFFFIKSLVALTYFFGSNLKYN